MANIRSSLALGLLCVHLIVTSLNIYFSVAAMRYLNNNILNSNNLRGTKERLLERNQNYFLEKEIETPKELRNLSPKAIRLSMLIINCISFYFIIQLFVSFFIDEDECCTKCNDDCCFLCRACCINCSCCDCNFDSSRLKLSGSSNNMGLGALGLAVVALAALIIIGLIYFLFYFGKHISRIIAIISLFVINATLVILSLYSGFDLNCILIASFSSFAVICDFLGILLPNLSCCEILTYEYASIPHIHTFSSIDEIDTKLKETQPQIETPKKEETYYEKPYYKQEDPVPEKASVELTPSTPDYIHQNKGSGSINGTSDTYDTPSYGIPTNK